MSCLRSHTSLLTRSLRSSVPRACGSFRRWQSSSAGLDGPTSAVDAVKSDATSLKRIIADSIKATGPLTIARYMSICVGHPTEGYYSRPNQDVFGTRGDFITSPEISQVFGELVGIWFMTQWLAARKPQRARLVELGPGRGTLMSDILRTLSTFKEARDSIASVHLVENSETLRSVQATTLQGGPKLEWHGRVQDIPKTDEFTMLVAHEFFDALPIHVFEKTDKGFTEVMVDLERPETSPEASAEAAETGGAVAPAASQANVSPLPPSEFASPSPASQADMSSIAPSTSSSPAPSSTELRLVRSRSGGAYSQVLPMSSPRFLALPPGSKLEISPESWSAAHGVAELLRGVEGGPGGVGLVVDYGDDKVAGDSFRAFRNHKQVGVLDDPGNCDLTADVDFAYLREAMGPIAHALGPITQRDFLLQLGLAPRLDVLLKNAASPERRREIASGARRLVDTDGMGQQYKVMGISAGPRTEGFYPFEAPAVEGSQAAAEGKEDV